MIELPEFHFLTEHFYWYPSRGSNFARALHTLCTDIQIFHCSVGLIHCLQNSLFSFNLSDVTRSLMFRSVCTVACSLVLGATELKHVTVQNFVFFT